MRTGRPKAELLPSNEERSKLQSFARSRSLPSSLSTRASIVLSSVGGEPNSAIANRLKLTKITVGKWRAQFIDRRIAGLYDDVRQDKPRTIDDERVAQLIKTTPHTKPGNALVFCVDEMSEKSQFQALEGTQSMLEILLCRMRHA